VIPFYYGSRAVITVLVPEHYPTKDRRDSPPEVDLAVGVAVVEDHVEELRGWLQPRLLVHLNHQRIFTKKI
jgi:hypothetical protein